MINLYPHQQDLICQLRNEFRTQQAVLLQGACGIGKTVIAAFIASEAAKKHKRLIFSVHRRELIKQTANTFSSNEIPFSYIANGYRPERSKLYIASVQTLINRIEKYPCDFLIVDECHLSRANGWSKVINHYKRQGAKILGLSGSPWRLDSRGLGTHFEKMICGPSIKWLMENNFLSEYKYYAPSNLDLSSLPQRMGDFEHQATLNLMNKPSVTGDVISHWLRLANGKRTLVYCVGIQHSKDVASAFRSAGISAEHVDGDSSDEIRFQFIKDFADRKINVMTNCMLWTEGLDISSQIGREVPIECIILLRPTKSLSLYIQMTGRGLRKKESPCIFLDHANLVRLHGMPDEDREWSLDDRISSRSRKLVSNLSVKICSNCFAAQRPGSSTCGICQVEFPVRPRKVLQLEGDLVEFRKSPERAHEEAMCHTLKDWHVLAKKLGYKSGWAFAKWNRRFG